MHKISDLSGCGAGWRWVSSTEVEFALELVLYSLSTGIGRPTPGAALLNLRYRDESQPGAFLTFHGWYSQATWTDIVYV